MGCCAVGTCTGVGCLCADIAKRFPPAVKCGKVAPADGELCALVDGHPRWQTCKSRKTLDGTARTEDSSTRDGAPKLAGEKVHTERSRKKNRQGPLYVPRSARV